jgi:WD40 repeat protein
MPRLLSTILFLFFLKTAFSQTTQTINYTVKEGLPSNSVYRSAIDKRGFLWVATENGLARFDGKKFKLFTTADGLTDNEIIDLFIDSAQRVWVIPFRRSPCYLNPLKDRFENEDSDPELRKIELGNTHTADVLEYGGVVFTNNDRHIFIYHEGKTEVYNEAIGRRTPTPQKVIEYKPGAYLLFCEDSLRYFGKDHAKPAVFFGQRLMGAEYINHKIYLASSHGISVMQVDGEGNLSALPGHQYPFEVRIFCKTGKSFAITTANGNTYIVDTASLEIRDNILNNIQVRNVVEDRDGNTWLATMENGLIKMQQKRISSFTAVPDLLKSFNAINKPGKIIAGTNRGEVYVYDGLYGIKKIQLGHGSNMDAWVRKIIELPQGIYVASQTGSYLFDPIFSKILRSFENAGNRSTKAAIAVNDSVLCLGNHAQATLFNINQGKAMDSVRQRVISLASSREQKIYIGSNDGLYRWDGPSLFYFGKNIKACTFRVNTICFSPDNILWVGLGSDSLLAIKDDKLIASMPLGGLIPGNICKSLFSNKAGEVWLGTNKGLNRVRYQLHGDQVSYNNTYFGSADGLIGDQVNDIFIKNDTVYVATVGGISYMPASLSLPVADIASFITGVSINSKDTVLADHYDLPYYRNDISISFSGVDLTGFIPLYEYSINDGPWQKTEKIELKRLAPGSYNVKIRAIKRDGKPSSQIAAMSFYIQTPFWQDTLFWIAVSLAIFTVIVYFLQRNTQRKQHAAIARAVTEKKLSELEMQALMSQINPHFIFNCLNSIKGFIYEQDYTQANKYLDKFSDLLRSTLDNAEATLVTVKEETKYLDTYLQLEKLRFDERFDYTLETTTAMGDETPRIPAMLLQPYVENAIRHGIRHLENKKGSICISIKENGRGLLCEIDDNGIGREKAQALRNEKHVEYQSRGMQLSRRRAKLYGISQEVIDKKDAEGNATGTKIVLHIPYTLNS